MNFHRIAADYRRQQRAARLARVIEAAAVRVILLEVIVLAALWVTR
jgi:hypothetical protein